MSWQQRTVDRLIAYRALGCKFEEAWSRAVRAEPPRGGDRDVATGTLFDEQGNVPETVYSFFKRVARDAWEDRIGEKGSGSGPDLRYFRVDMLRALDEEEPAYVKRTAA